MPQPMRTPALLWSHGSRKRRPSSCFLLLPLSVSDAWGQAVGAVAPAVKPPPPSQPCSAVSWVARVGREQKRDRQGEFPGTSEAPDGDPEI